MRALSACHRLSLVIRQKTFRVESIPQRSNPSLFTDERGKLRPKGALTCLEPSQTQVRDSGFLNLSQKEQDLKWMSVPLWRHPVTVINGGAFDTQETGCTDGGGKGGGRGRRVLGTCLQFQEPPPGGPRHHQPQLPGSNSLAPLPGVIRVQNSQCSLPSPLIVNLTR